MNRRNFFKSTIVAGAISALGIGCGSIYRDNFASPKFWGKIQEFSLDQKINNRKVLLIGIDGLRPDALEVAKTPHLDSLMEGGIYCNNVFTGPHTISGSGWSNVFTGVWPNKHNVIDNVFSNPRYDKYPTLFTRLEKIQSDLYTVSLVTWKSLNEIINTKMDYGAYYRVRVIKIG